MLFGRKIGQLEIVPHKGLGQLYFGTHRHDVERVVRSRFGLTLTDRRDSIDYFADARLRVEYWSDDTVSYIETSYSNNFVTLYRGVNVFDQAAYDLYLLGADKEQDELPPYSDDEVLLSDQILVFWNAGVEYDYYKDENRKVFAVVGIGDDRYLQAILEKS